MGNPTKGEATVTLDDGRTLTFAFDINAWIDIADELDMTVPDVVKALSDKDNPPDLKFQRAVFWGALQKHHPEMSVRDAGAVMQEAAPAMAEAMEKAFPAADGEAEGGSAGAGPRKPRHGTGTKPRPPGRG